MSRVLALLLCLIGSTAFSQERIFRADTAPYEERQLAPCPPEPEPQPEPIPDDRFNNIGKRVADWTKGLPKAPDVATIYEKYSKLALSNQFYSVKDMQNALIAEREALLGNDRAAWSDFVARLTTDYTAQRALSMDRTDLSEYWAAIAKGLRK